MLDCPEKDVAIGQPAVLVGVQHASIRQANESVERICRANVPVFGTVNQLQRLHDELDVADRAGSQFNLAPFATASAQVGLDPALGLLHGCSHVFGSGSENERLRATQQVAAQVLRPGDHSRLEKCLLLPHLGVRLEVLQVRRNRGDEFSRSAPRPQPNVHAVEKALARRVLQRLDQSLRDRQCLCRAAVREKDQVDVRTVVQFLAAELAQREDRQVRRVHHQFVTGQRETGLNQTVGQQTELHGRRTQVNQTEGVARADSQQFPTLKPSQGVQPRRVVGGRADYRQRAVQKLLATLQIGQSAMSNQFPQRLWVPQNSLGQIPTAGEQSDEHFNGSRVVVEKLKQLSAIRRALDESLEVDQPRVRIGHLREQADQFVQAAGREVRCQLRVDQSAQPTRRTDGLAKSEPRQSLRHHSASSLVTVEQRSQFRQHAARLHNIPN